MSAKRIICTRALALLAVALCAGSPVRAAPRPLAREVLALYDGREEPNPRFSRIHRFAEMPLNHLGLVVRFADVREPLPALARGDGVRGVITWFGGETVPDPEAYLRWALEALASGKRLVVLGPLGLGRDGQGRPMPVRRVNPLLAALGVRAEDRTVTLTYDYRILAADPAVYAYEHPLGGVLPAFQRVHAHGARARSYLRLRRGDDPASDVDLVVTGPAGGYVARGYAYYPEYRVRWGQWYLNPFAFLRRALATDDLPKPDPTTLAGRRIYYSHIDGDGWRNAAEIERYRKRQALASEVVLEEAVRPYPDLPVSVAPVAADLDPAWYGDARSRAVARALFALPQVEVATHTYTHPFRWGFFEDYSPQRERRYLPEYPELRDRVAQGLPAWGIGPGELAPATRHRESTWSDLRDLPRAYAARPFDLDLEIAGSAAYLATLAPPGKPVALIQWSGDTEPFESALALAARTGMANLNGGDTRFDLDYPSHAWIAPIGRRVGPYWQIYASASNENTYTAEWTTRFFGFKYLPATIEGTESPLRLKPVNVYYHMYSGAKEASLAALRANLDYARGLEIAPIAASRYARIAEGFFATRIVALGERRWRIEGRGALSTVRLDGAAARHPDLAASSGVIGWRRHQGSLYVALDERVAAPVIALDSGREPAPRGPSLIESRWRVYGLERDGGGGWRFTARGFGRGRMRWRSPPGARYRLRIALPEGGERHQRVRADPAGVVALDLGRHDDAELEVTLEPLGAAR